jgi:hypothetical protein
MFIVIALVITQNFHNNHFVTSPTRISINQNDDYNVWVLILFVVLAIYSLIAKETLVELNPCI